MNKGHIALLGLIVSGFNHFIPSVHAASEFSTSFNSLYTISQAGETAVAHTITLKNNLAHIYATQYSIATSGDQLKNITVADEVGPLPTTTNIQNGITTIHLAIERPAIGKDQTKTLTLSYFTDDVVEKIGTTTTINIPRLARANEAESYTRIVKVAGVSGQSSLIFPPQNKTETDELYTTYTFNGHQSDSLALLFGSSVNYQLDLTYELKNKELSPKTSELALPPDTGYQSIILDSIIPPPESISLDQNGNWLALYRLKAQEKLQINARLFATVYPQPVLKDPSPTNYVKTSHSKYWSSNGDTVSTLAKKLTTPFNIYEYLVTNFVYNYAGQTTGASRQGAQAALSAPSNVLCTEFTDSFIALARESHIPTREVNGYGYTKNSTLQPISTTSDILHAWPEYFDEKLSKWVSIDPTWGNTTGGIDYFNKLDFGHIAFIRRGIEDSYPLPAGAYKSDPTQKHVQVAVTKDLPTPDSRLEVSGQRVYNHGNIGVYDARVGYLPPYGSGALPSSKELTVYDKIKALCVKLFSKFSRLLPAST